MLDETAEQLHIFHNNVIFIPRKHQHRPNASDEDVTPTDSDSFICHIFLYIIEYIRIYIFSIIVAEENHKKIYIYDRRPSLRSKDR